MISRAMTLAEVAATISERLKREGIEVCVVGGSAIALHSPSIYTSLDIDFAVLTGINKRLESALRALGYHKDGRSYAHPDSSWTIDIVADTPYVGSRAISAFDCIQTAHGSVQVYRIEDALVDRLAHFLFWSDSEALDVATRVATEHYARIDWSHFHEAVKALDATDRASAQRLDFALKRLNAR